MKEKQKSILLEYLAFQEPFIKLIIKKLLSVILSIVILYDSMRIICMYPKQW